MKSLILLLFFLTTSLSQNLYNDTTIQVLNLEFYFPAWKDSLVKHVPTETDIPAKLIVDGIIYDSIGVRYKGNSSYNISSDKKPFNLSIDAYKENQLLYGYKTLNLNNFFKDPTCVREKIAYEIISKYMPAVKSAYVKLYINNVYWGLYLNVQQINKIFLREHFSVQGGNLYKGDPPNVSGGGVFGGSDLTWNGSDTNYYRARYELKTNEDKNDWTSFLKFIYNLNNLPSNTFEVEIQKYINVDRALWYIALCNIFVNLDSYIGSGHNYYIYDASNDGMNIILWDLNEVLGTFSNEQLSIQQREELSPFYKSTDIKRPLVSKLLSVTNFKERYLAHFRTLLNEVLSENYWKPDVEKYQKLILTPLTEDTKKLYSISQFQSNVTTNITGGSGPGGNIPGIYTFINNRKKYLETHSNIQVLTPTITKLIYLPENPNDNDSITCKINYLNGVEAKLYYSVNNFPFNSKNMLANGSETFEVKIGPFKAADKVNYYVELKNVNGSVKYFPERSEFVTNNFKISSINMASPIVINEIMASNTKTIKDLQNEYDDWIEIYNLSTDTVNLAGMYMADSKTAKWKWKIPQNTKINPKGYLMIWADEDTTDVGALHSNFKLSKSGEACVLWDTSGVNIIDSTTFGVQQDDKSWGRYPDGTGSFSIINPTPNSSNILVKVAEEKIVPTIFYLDQNYPNPFNPETKIKFGISENSVVKVEIFNSLGQKVETLVDEKNMSSGEYFTTWIPSKINSGFYFCKLTAEIKGQTKIYSKTIKLVLLK